jgi:two-component sensor histidine kinase
MVANSLKYAFPNRRAGLINIKLHSDNDKEFNLIVGDNGVGIPEDIDSETAETFGMQLIKYLTKQLKGTLELDRNHGTKYKLQFTELKYIDRVK